MQLFVRMLTVVSGQVAAGQCTSKYDGMKTCTILNGASTSGDTLLMPLIDAGSNKAYTDGVAKGEIKDTSACKTAYAQFNCVFLAGMLSAAPCDSKGAPMLPCYEMCTDYMLQCSPKENATDAAAACDFMTNSDVKMTATKGATCFGTPRGSTISWVDITFVVVTLVCELYTTLQLCRWYGSDGYYTAIRNAAIDRSLEFAPGADGKCTHCSEAEGSHFTRFGKKYCCTSIFCRGVHGKCIYCSRSERRHYVHSDGSKYCWSHSSCGGIGCMLCSLVVSVGCSVGKLFPPGATGYFFCSTNQCSKVVHNSVMTILIFYFSDIWQCMQLHAKAGSDPISTRPNLCFKIFQVMVSLGYLIYDALNEDAPGPGSTFLVVYACLSEFLVWCSESSSLYKTYRSTGGSNPEPSYFFIF
jgi:hypothetical protein